MDTEKQNVATLLKLAKEYSDASYLVSEENHDKQEEVIALEKLRVFYESSLAEAVKNDRERIAKDVRSKWEFFCKCARNQVNCTHDFHLMSSIINVVRNNK